MAMTEDCNLGFNARYKILTIMLAHKEC